MSENHQLFKVIDTVSLHAGDKGIYAIDRGGDRGRLYDKFLGVRKTVCHPSCEKNLAVALPLSS